MENILCLVGKLSLELRDANKHFYIILYEQKALSFRLSDVSLADIFGEETIPGITSVEQGIEFCRSLVSGSNPHYAIFPVLIDSEETYSNGYPKYKYINRWGYVDQWGQFRDSLQAGKDVDFYNSVVRS